MSAPVRSAQVDAITGVPARAFAAVTTNADWAIYASAFVASKHHDRRPRT